MRRIPVASMILALLPPTIASAQDGPAPPSAAVYAGLGHAFGGLGVRAEGLILSGRLSALAGVGVLIGGEVENVEWAASVRCYAGSVNHRAFVDFSWSWLGGSCLTGISGSCSETYGPGISLGYSYVSNAGLTLTGGAGLGWARNHPREFVFQLGVGWTWRQFPL